MLVNLDELSANDLLELAKKKQQQEEENARRAALAGRLAQLRKRREQLLSDQERALAILDKELQSLQQRRLQLAATHQMALSALDKEMAEMTAGANDAPHVKTNPASSQTAPVKAPETTVSRPAVQTDVEDSFASGAEYEANEVRGSAGELDAAILQLLRGRLDMSDSLMREQLRSKGLDLSRFGKALEQLVREGKVVNKGSGNYALKKRL